MPLPTWPSYLGDDTGLKSPRTESGRLGGEGEPEEEKRNRDNYGEETLTAVFMIVLAHYVSMSLPVSKVY